MHEVLVVDLVLLDGQGTRQVLGDSLYISPEGQDWHIPLIITFPDGHLQRLSIH